MNNALVTKVTLHDRHTASNLPRIRRDRVGVKEAFFVVLRNQCFVLYIRRLAEPLTCSDAARTITNSKISMTKQKSFEISIRNHCTAELAVVYSSVEQIKDF